MQQLASKITGGASGAIAEQGAGAFISMIKEKVSGGGIGDLMGMFSGAGADAGGMVAGFQEKLGGIMQEQGVSAEDATAQAGAIAPDIFNTVKEKFASGDAADAGFDLNALAGLAGGAGLGDMLSGAADMLKGGADKAEGGAGDLLGKVKDLF